MLVMPSEYQHINLSRDEKIFIRNTMSHESDGYLLIGVNPAMLSNESMHLLMCSDGFLLLKFFDRFEDVSKLGFIIANLKDSLYSQTSTIVKNKLMSNKALVDQAGKLRFSVNIVYVFPLIREKDINDINASDIRSFCTKCCMFKEDLLRVRTDLKGIFEKYLSNSITDVSEQRLIICDNNVNSIIQRIAPEYVTIRVASLADENTYVGADNELLVVTEQDTAVKAFRLDAEQINIVNKISKGDQLILACAGSGKSVLLIAKCFKAAQMNPDKQFLITCYNRNLYSLYTWFIDRAGLKEKNVKCLTFHALCRKLLLNNRLSVIGYDADGLVKRAIEHLNKGRIKDRFYGIFIDEVQQFDTEWYKFCYNLLENKSSDDHLFVICGDKTQKLANLQKHGRAPWNAGEGYPNYRGGNKNIRIERNYRNCIEINEYINRFVSSAKRYLFSINPDTQLDPDEFLRGKSVFHGNGVVIKHLQEFTNHEEAKMIVESIVKIHDEYGIPYDEIAIVIYNRKYRKRLANWKSSTYNLETPLMSLLSQKDIPYCVMYNRENEWAAQYGEDGGVKFVGFQTVLGLDFRAAIVCGIKPLGDYKKTKTPNWDELREDEEQFENTLSSTKDDIRLLYVACTRAKEILHIILPESGDDSVFVKMIEDAE